jgi:hypothetical protein
MSRFLSYVNLGSAVVHTQVHPVLMLIGYIILGSEGKDDIILIKICL